MSKRLKLDTSSQTRQELDEQGWSLYNRHLGSVPADLVIDEFLSWPVALYFVHRRSQKDGQKVDCFELFSKTYHLEVFNCIIPISWIFKGLLYHHSQAQSLSAPGHCKMKKYGFKQQELRLEFHILILKRALPTTASWLYSKSCGIIYGYQTANGTLIIEKGWNTPRILPEITEPDDFTVPMSGLKNLHQPVLHFKFYYLCKVLECDSPILEALFINWPWDKHFGGSAGFIARNMPIYNDFTPHLYECKNGVIRGVSGQKYGRPDREEFKKCYK